MNGQHWHNFVHILECLWLYFVVQMFIDLCSLRCIYAFVALRWSADARNWCLIIFLWAGFEFAFMNVASVLSSGHILKIEHQLRCQAGQAGILGGRGRSRWWCFGGKWGGERKSGRVENAAACCKNMVVNMGGLSMEGGIKDNAMIRWNDKV